MSVKDYITALRNKMMPLLVEKQENPTTHHCCIQFSHHDITILHLNQTPNGIDILHNEVMHFDNLADLHLVLSGMVERYALEQIPTTLLLSPEHYQLFIIDALPVKQNEIHQALQWRLRSLISYPIEQAVSDYFILPGKIANQNNLTIAVAVANKATIQPLIEVVQQGGFSLNAINIPEMAMRHLASLYESDERSTAFIYFYDNLAILTISHQGNIYFTRHIDVSMAEATLLPSLEEFSLELLRYFDYYQGQSRRPAPNRIFIATYKQNTEDIAETLSKLLTTHIQPFVLPKTTIKEVYLLAFGAALNEEMKNALTAN